MGTFLAKELYTKLYTTQSLFKHALNLIKIVEAMFLEKLKTCVLVWGGSSQNMG